MISGIVARTWLCCIILDMTNAPPPTTLVMMDKLDYCKLGKVCAGLYGARLIEVLTGFALSLHAQDLLAPVSEARLLHGCGGGQVCSGAGLLVCSFLQGPLIPAGFGAPQFTSFSSLPALLFRGRYAAGSPTDQERLRSDQQGYRIPLPPQSQLCGLPCQSVHDGLACFGPCLYTFDSILHTHWCGCN